MNPLLKDHEILSRFQALSPENREVLKDFTRWLYNHARIQAERSWKLSKAPMAVYWKAVAAWSYHITRIL